MPATIETLTGAVDPNEAPNGKAYALRVRLLALCNKIEQSCEVARATARTALEVLAELNAIDKAK